MKMIQCASCKMICDEGSHICKFCGSPLQDESVNTAFGPGENWPSFSSQDDQGNIDISACSLLPPGDMLASQNLPVLPHKGERAYAEGDTFQPSMKRCAVQYSVDVMPQVQQKQFPAQQQQYATVQREEDRRDDDPVLPLLVPAAGMPGVQEGVPSVQGTPQIGFAPSVQGTPQMHPSVHNAQADHQQKGHQRNHGGDQQHNASNMQLRWPLPNEIKRRNTRTKRLLGGAIVTCVVLVGVIGWYFIHPASLNPPKTSNSSSSPTAASTASPTPTGSPAPQQFHPMMISSGNMIPGGSLTLHGTGFPAGGTVTFTVDGTPLAYSGSPPAQGYAAPAKKIPHARLMIPADMPTTVRPDGTFDKTFLIPSNWEPGSTHHIRAVVRSNQSEAQVELGLKMQPPPTQTGASPTPTPTTCVGASTQQLNFTGVTGKSDPVSQSISINNCAQGGNWSAAITTSDGAKWLSASMTSGTLAMGATQAISISALNVETGLAAGTYSGHITFTLGYSTVTVNVSLAVANNPCIQASTQAMTFNGIAGTSDPAAQGVTLTNCGDTSNWTVQMTTTSGGFWLSTNSTGGTLQGGSTQDVNVIASNVSVNLPPGTYQGSVTFSIGPSLATINVTLTVAKGPCIQASTQALSFSAVAGQQNPASQTVLLTSCGSGANWTAAISNNTAWLSVDQSSGSLSASATQNISVSASIANVQAGIYTGSITFTMGSSVAVVSVTLTVVKAPCLQTSAQLLSFSAVAGTSDPAAQSFTLTNCGPAGNWSVSTVTSDGARWLTTNPTSGSLNAGAGQSISVTVASVNAKLRAGTYTGHLTFTQGTASATVTINLTVVLPPCFQASSSSLSFSGDPGIALATQTVTLTDCGPDGTWSGSVSTQDGASWLSATNNGTTSGSVSSGNTVQITVGVNSKAVKSPGTYNGTASFTIKTVSGSANVTLSVTYTVTQPACLQVGGSSSTTLVFSGTVGSTKDPSPQAITLTNCGGSGTLSASISYNSGSGWVTTNLSNGTALSAGSSNPNITVGTTVANLAAGSYSATMTITITTSSGSTSSVTVNVTLSVITQIS